MSNRTPDEIKSDLMDEVMPGASKESVQHLVWEVIEDVIDSFKLAGTDPDIITTVEDYVSNHYGIDDGWTS